LSIYSGKEQKVTLYEKLAEDFCAEIREKRQQGPVVVVFAGMCVRRYKGQFSIYPFINLFIFIGFYHVRPYNCILFIAVGLRNRIYSLLFIIFKVLPRFGNTRSTRIPREVSGLYGSSFKLIIDNPP
jgi:hypothetical protein